MPHQLDYARPPPPRPPSLWPYKSILMGAAAIALLAISLHVLTGVMRVNDTSRVAREETWMLMFGPGVSCLFVLAMCWWGARRLPWRPRAFRRAFWTGLSLWLIGLSLMLLRSA